MIDKREILEISQTLGLGPQVVEKDYVLGWVLAGISNHDALRDNWVFKGGTCLKKCFFETYRFSEDLDFTLKDESQIDETFLHGAFNEIGEWVYEQCGLELPAEMRKFDIFKNPRGTISCQGTIAYRGPVSPKGKNIPRIKLDLTADERLVLQPVTTQIFHPYTDEPDGGIEVKAYAYEECFGEKVRALGERTRPRDLYDVINLYRNKSARPAPAVILDVLQQKCDFKNIGVPKLEELEHHRDDLEGSWENMLGHQLQVLPDVNSFWGALPEFFAWLFGDLVATEPAAYALGRGERVLSGRTLRLPVPRKLQSLLEVIRFAAANRLCVDLKYAGSTRRIEAYSLRETKDGNIILHAWDVNKDAHRSYRVDRMEGVQSTNQGFSPRYEIELTAGSVQSIPQTERSAASYGGSRGSRRRSGLYRSGPIYIYECTSCGKRFRREKRNRRNRPHKTPDGFDCRGKSSILVDTEY
jgi:predicted nucleotidyltransferase component of viral defense system